MNTVRTGLSARDRWRTAAGVVGVFVAPVAFGLIFLRSEPDSYDTYIMALVAHSMVTGHGFFVNPALDAFHVNSPYASYGLGMSLLMAPGFLAGPLFHRPPEELYMAVNAVLLGAIALSCFLFCRRIAGGLVASVTALLIVLATPLFTETSTGFSEVGTALGVSLGLLGLQEATGRPGRGAMLVGVGAGASVLMRPDSVVLVAPLLVLALLLVTRAPRAIAGVVAGLVPGALVTAGYNTVRFGSPLRFGYANDLIFNHPFGAGLYGLIASPSDGLLLYAPLVVVAAAGVGWAWRRNRVVTSAAVVLLLVRIAFYAPWWSWNGGVAWGPRFLIPAMPVLAVGVVEVIGRFGRLPVIARAAVVALAGVSLLVQVVGTAVIPGAASLWTQLGLVHFGYDAHFDNFIAVASSPRTERISDGYYFNWSLCPIVSEARLLVQGKSLTSHFMTPRPHHKVLLGLGLLGVGGVALSVLPWLGAREAEPAALSPSPR